MYNLSKLSFKTYIDFRFAKIGNLLQGNMFLFWK